MIRSVLALLDIRPAYTRLMAERHDFHRYDLLDDKQAFLDEMGAQIRAVVTSARFGVPADLLAQLPSGMMSLILRHFVTAAFAFQRRLIS